MKEVILVSPKLGIGGIQRAMTNLANWFVNNGYQVTLISCKKEDLFYPLDDKVNVIIPQFNYSLKYGKIIYYLSVIRYLRRTINSIDSKFVFSFGEAFNPLVLIATIGLKKKVFISDRTSPDFKHPFFTEVLRKLTYPMTEMLIVQTTKSLNYNKKKFQNINLTVIPNFIKTIDKNLVEKEKWILYVGRFALEKAPERLIRAYANIKNKHGYKLIMCGDGPLLESMKILVKDLGCEEKIEFKGQVRDVQSFYNKSAIYVLPSVLEGFPNALCEAMASGLACICFNTIPYEDIGLPDIDFLVIGVTNEKLEEAISLLIQDDMKRQFLSQNASKIYQKLNNNIIGNKYIDLLSLKEFQ